MQAGKQRGVKPGKNSAKLDNRERERKKPEKLEVDNLMIPQQKKKKKSSFSIVE